MHFESRISERGEYKLLPYDVAADPQWCEWFPNESGDKNVRRYCRASYDHVEQFILSDPEQDWHRNGGPSVSSFCPSLFEILCRDKPTKPYLDLDWEYQKIPDLTDARVVQLVNMIKNAANTILRASLAKSVSTHEALDVEPCLLASKRAKKYSIHAVWNIVNMETGDQWAFANGACAKQWAVDLRSELVARHGVDMKDLIDVQPYCINVGKTYNFRVAGATKGIEPRSRLDLYDEGGLVPLRQLSVDDRLAYWRASLVQFFMREPKPLVYEEHKSTGNRTLDTTGSRVVSQAGSIRGVGEVKLHASIIRAPFELEACACLEEYIRWYSECVERPHALKLEPFTHRSTSVYRVDINVWQGWCNWTSQSGLCHTKLKRPHEGGHLHRSNNVYYSLTYHRPQLLQRCPNTQCKEWRDDLRLTFVKLPEVPDERGLLRKAQRLMAASCVQAPAEPEPVPASPLLSPGNQAITELTCDALYPGPDGHHVACTHAQRGEPFQGSKELMREIARLAPRTATHCCVLSCSRPPLPRARATGVRFKCMSMVMWGDLLKHEWLKGSRVCELTAPVRTWFLCWNTSTAPQLQSGVKVEPGIVPLLAQPSIQHTVPCSVNTPFWFSTIGTHTARPSVAMVHEMYKFPFEGADTSAIYRNAKDLLPRVERRFAVRMIDTVRIGGLLLSVMYAPADCEALKDMAASTSNAIPEFDETAQERAEAHFHAKDTRCLKVGRHWATSVWVDGPGATSDHMKALFCMLHGLLATSFL